MIDAVMLSFLTASSSSGGGGGSTLEIVAFIGIPLFLALVGAIFGAIKGSIRFAQYMAHSEEAQDSIAKSNTEINDKMSKFMEKTDAHFKDTEERLNTHDQDIAVLKYVIRPNGTEPFPTYRPPPRRVAGPEEEHQG